MTNSILLEKLEKRAQTQFNSQDISDFAMLYILFHLRLREIDSSSISDAIKIIYNLNLSEEKKKLLLKYVDPMYRFADLEEIKSAEIIRSFFAATSCDGNNTSTKIPSELYSFISFLLDFKEDDNIGLLYSEPYSFSEYISKNYTVKSITGYEALEQSYAFYLFKKEILGIEDNINIYNVDLHDTGNLLIDKFSKIYSFPKIYQKQNSNTLGNERVSLNMERSFEDNTILNITKTLNCLEENGRALVLVSNAFFTRNYELYHEELIDDKLLTGVIHLPAGSVYPPNLAASLLVFDNKKDNKAVRFLDLRPSASDFYKAEDLALIRKLWLGQDSENCRTISYEKIKENKSKLNFVAYKDKEKSGKNFFILGEEAQIFKSMQVSPEIKTFEEVNSSLKDYNPSRLLRISDISENRIQHTMPLIISEQLPPEAEKSRLEENDIVISKILPLKLALYNSRIFDCVYAGANLFIIRLNRGSKLRPGFLKAYFESTACATEFNQRASGGTMQVLSKKILETMKIPCFSEQEQLALEEQYFSNEKKILELEANIKELQVEQKEIIDGLF